MNNTRILDYADAFSGYAFPSEDLTDYGTPVIKIGNIHNGIVEPICDSFYNKEITNNLKKYIYNKNDFLIAMTGAGSVGRAGKMLEVHETYLVNQRVAIVRCRENANSTYLFYFFRLPFVEQYLYSLGIGAGQPNISARDILNMKVMFPPIDKQNRIAFIISQYDSLIEANNKRIKILEQMAAELYKEWFVRFRFPGYETAEFENGIPKGWEYTEFSKVFSFDRGVSYSSEEIECDVGENLINLKNIQGYGGFRRDGTKKYNGKYKSEQIVGYKDLIMGVTDMTQDRRTVGSVALIPSLSGVISADLIKLNSNISSIFLYCLFRYGAYSKYISQFGNGANVIHLKPSSIKNVKLLIPKTSIIRLFDEKIEPVIDHIDILNQKNDNLIKQRDLLLPRLMSGKLEV